MYFRAGEKDIKPRAAFWYIIIFMRGEAFMSLSTKPVFKRLTPEELSLFFTETSMFYQAGIPLGEGLHILKEASSGEGGRILAELNRLIEEESMPFSKALSEVSCFPDYAVNMIDIGERSGKLDAVMSSLGRYYERESTIDKNVRGALTYPMIMVSMMSLVVMVLISYVLPVFSRVLTQLGGDMGTFPRAAMNFGQFIINNSLLFIIVFVLFVVFIAVLRFAPSDNSVVSGLRYFLFGGSATAAKVDAGRFASAMNLMLSSGLDAEESLDSLERLMDSESIRAKVKLCREAISDGVSLSDSLIKSNLFDSGMAVLLPLGFKTGNMEKVMGHIADKCESEVDDRIDRAIAVIEPSLVGVLSTVVGAILLSTMIPLWSIMTTIGF